jgi:hypothetical protein
LSPDRERGFIVVQRQIQSSALWLSLNAKQRAVMIQLILMANWAPSRARWKGEWYEVDRGELSHTMATIAAASKVSVAVVRSAIEALMADDRNVGGNGPFLAQRYPVSNTGPSTGPRVLTIINYNKHQDVPESRNTGSNTDPAQVNAQTSHRPRTDPAQREQDKPDQPVQPPLALSPAGSPLTACILTIPCVGTGPKEVGITQQQIERWQGLFPGIDVLGQVRAAVAWCEANPTKRKTASGVPRFVTSWLTRAQDAPARPRGSTGQPDARKGMSTPSKDFSDTRAPWELS